MKKLLVIISMIVGLVGCFVLIKKYKQSQVSAQYTIGIVQTASHPALDAVKEGFMEELSSKLGDSVAYIIQNAQGSVSQAHTIAQQLQSNKQCSGFLTIATAPTQAMSTLEKERPIFIGAVTDPHALGLVHPTTNVCGTQDMIDVKADMDMLTQLLPQAKTVGLLYTSGELNSLVIGQIRAELEKRGLTPLNFAVSNEADIPAVVELACRKADVLFAPTDNTIASAVNLVAAIALKYKKPLILSDTMLLIPGVLAARGVDYKDSGKQTARIAYKVLVEGAKPHEIPIEQAKSESIMINQETLKALGISIPESMKKDVLLKAKDKQ